MKKLWLAFVLLAGLPCVALGQTNGMERAVNRHALASGKELLLYEQPNETSRTVRIGAFQPIHVTSEIDSVWYRVIFDGSPFFAKRTDVELAPATTAGVKKPAVAKPHRK